MKKRQKQTTPTGLDWLVLMLNLKDKGLTKVSLFKNNFCKSWAYLPKTGQILIHKDTQATNWNKYIKNNQVAGIFGKALKNPGYIVNRYKRGFGIKGATVFKPKKPTVVNTFAQGFIKFGIEQGYIK